MSTDRVCIIGAGTSGLPCAKWLKEAGIPFDCYEKGSDLGGLWRYDNDNGQASAYASLHINTSKARTAYSDFPMPADYPDYPSHRQMLAYLESYADRFGLREHIRFKTPVESVERAPSGGFLVRAGGSTREYRAVLVANGHHWNPRLPEPAFPGTFSGTTMHSHYYRTPAIFPGKRVLVVGFGNSALDIACDAARASEHRVLVSTRSSAHIIPKYVLGLPTDTFNTPFIASLPMFVQRALFGFLLWLARGDQERFGIPRPRRPLFSEHPTASQDVIPLAGAGRIKIKPNIRSLDGDRVSFTDGTTELVDTIVYCTGYRIRFPFLSPDLAMVGADNEFPLYLRVVPPSAPGLFFIGLVQPLGAVAPLAEAQARWVARILKGEARLPAVETMRAELEREQSSVHRQFYKSPRHTIQVQFFPYLRELEREMRRTRT